MTYLKTPTHNLTTKELRKVICETIKWCEANVGTKRKFKTLKYQVRTLPKKYEPAYGQYDPTINTIRIFRNHCPDVKMVVRVVLHEYCHFLQKLNNYDKILKQVGYQNHPQEREARVMETMYSICWKDIKSKL